MLKNMKRPQRPLMFDKVRKTYNAFKSKGLRLLLSSLPNHRDVNIRRGEAKTAEVNVARNLKIKTSSQIPAHNTHLKASQDKEAKRLSIWYLVN